MKLTQFTDLGLRILMYLSYQERELPVKIIEMSEQFNISRNHLIKVVNKLAKLEWVSTERGRYGGVRLAIDPKLLTVGEIVRELEESIQLVACDVGPCSFVNNCGAQAIFARAMQQFMRELDSHSLADVVAGNVSQDIKLLHSQYTQIS
jgi:Rrf2 family nitric oxide-sensitive transcriptional repressor